MADISRDALERWFCNPRCSGWSGEERVGAEFEVLVVDRRTRKEAPFDGPRGVEAVLESLSRNGWATARENGRLIALERAGATVTLEPGSQLELSTSPRRTVVEIEADLRSFLAELGPVLEKMDLVALATGLNPFSTALEVPLGPKKRYAIMTEYLSRKGDLAIDMMRRTLSVHCSFDYRDEADAIEKARVAFAAAPVVTAMFAHSGVDRVAPNGYQTFRAEIWRRTDPDRCGQLPEVYEEGWGFARYLERILGLPLIFTYRDGEYRPANGRRAREWFAGGWDGLTPAVDDLEWVINQSFRDARLRRYLECRAADFPSPHMATAPVALWTGLLYDADARREAWTRLAALGAERREAMIAAVPRDGLRAAGVLALARELAALARRTLVARGHGEERLLDPLDALLADGRSPTDALLDGWTAGDADALIERLRIA